MGIIKLDTHLYKIIDSQITVNFYKDHRDLIFNEEELCNKILKKITPLVEHKKNSLFSLSLSSLSLLLHFDFYAKELNIACERLSRELIYLGFDNSDQQLKDHILKFKNAKDLLTVGQQVQLENDLIELSEIDSNTEYSTEFDTNKKRLLININTHKNSLFEMLSDFGLNLTANYAIIRIHILKFIATLSCLDHDKKGHEVKRLFIESMKRMLRDSRSAKKAKSKGQSRALPKEIVFFSRFVLYVSSFLPSNILQMSIKYKVRFLAKRFIAGENITQALVTLDKLSETKRSATLDQLGELVVSSFEADQYQDSVIEITKGLSKKYTNGEVNEAGVLLAHVSIKVSALSPNFKAHSFESTFNDIAPRLKKILIFANEKNVFINIDAEHYSYRDTVFEIYKKVLLETSELHDYQATGIVVQAYLRDSASHLKEIIELAKERRLNMPVRLVKGAYWDAETVEAQAHNFNAPQFLNKEESDICFRQLIFEILKHGKNIQLAIASHNIHDHCFAQALRSTMFKESPVIEHQCLHMTYTALSIGLAKMGWAVRNYVPVGNLLVGMSYLVRRIMENSSQVGFLTLMRSHKRLGSYFSPGQIHSEKIKKKTIIYDEKVDNFSPKFFNIEPVRLFLKDEMAEFKKSLSDFSNSLPLKNLGDTKVYSSSDNSIYITDTFTKNLDQINDDIQTSKAAYLQTDWRTNTAKRINSLLKAAELLTIRRAELSSLIMYEAGKTVYEALADVDEAVDFINFYSRQALKIFKDSNAKPIGPIAVIAPWNFPLAIACGMSVAPLVSGNTVILKPAQTTTVIAKYLVDILHEAGVPKEVFIYSAGPGSVIGQQLVESDDIVGIVFTGSKAVGINIFKETQSKLIKFDNNILKKVAITEMGGKNAVVVTNNCELDETIAGILYASFAHAGQKCSACSRIVIDNQIKGVFLERFIQAVKELNIGKAYDFSTDINPLVSNAEKEKIISLLPQILSEADENGGTVHLNNVEGDYPGSAIGPLIIELTKERAMNTSSFASRELFCPIIHIIGYDNLMQATDIVNASEYALTAGIYCQSQNDIDYLGERIHAGNIYINRPNTGARVAVEPFGGFKLSGTGPKAGGKDYLYEFINTNSNPTVAVDSMTSSGSDYSFSLARPSGLSMIGRVKRFSKYSKSLLADYETMVNDIDPKRVAALRDFSKYLEENYKSFCFDKVNNKFTKGQLNYSMSNLFHGNSLYICYEEKPSLHCLQFFLASLISGSGISILTRNERTFAVWSTLISSAHAAGFSKHNVEVYFSSAKVLATALANPKISFQFIDGSEQVVSEVMAKSYTDKNFIRYIKKVYTPFSPFSYGDYGHFLNHTHFKRSYAVNIMRHGAPLALNE